MKTTVLAVCVLHASLARAISSLLVHHRIWNPVTPSPPFSLRGALQVSSEIDSITLVQDDRVDLVLDSDQPDNTLYQIALQREGDLSESDWDVSSVKACHLPQAQTDIMNLRLSTPDKIPYALDFFLHPIPHDGSCPKGSSARRTITFTNTTLTFQFASTPPLPELRVPPPLTPKGEPIQPIPEQSFIQKYWMYIAIGLMTLVLTGGGAPDEEQGGQGRGGGGGGGARAGAR